MLILWAKLDNMLRILWMLSSNKRITMNQISDKINEY